MHMISVVIPVDWLHTSQTELKRGSCIHKYTYKESDILEAMWKNFSSTSTFPETNEFMKIHQIFTPFTVY